MQEDGVVYVEIRTSLKNLGKGYEEYLRAVLRGIQKVTSDQFEVRLLLSLQRASSIEQARATVDLAIQYRDLGVVGIDISGNSTLGQIETIVPELLRAKRNGLFLALHIGESAREFGQKDVLELLNPDRIGHGVHLSLDAQDWILKNKIPLEVCLTSSVLVQMVQESSLHPGLRYYSQDHPIVICTDDPLIFRTSLSHELMILNQHVPLAHIEKVVKAGFEHSFLPLDKKRDLLEKYHPKVVANSDHISSE